MINEQLFALGYVSRDVQEYTLGRVEYSRTFAWNDADVIGK